MVVVIAYGNGGVRWWRRQWSVVGEEVIGGVTGVDVSGWWGMMVVVGGGDGVTLLSFSLFVSWFAMCICVCV